MLHNGQHRKVWPEFSQQETSSWIVKYLISSIMILRWASAAKQDSLLGVVSISQHCLTDWGYNKGQSSRHKSSEYVHVQDGASKAVTNKQVPSARALRGATEVTQRAKENMEPRRSGRAKQTVNYQ